MNSTKYASAGVYATGEVPQLGDTVDIDTDSPEEADVGEVVGDTVSGYKLGVRWRRAHATYDECAGALLKRNA